MNFVHLHLTFCIRSLIYAFTYWTLVDHKHCLSWIPWFSSTFSTKAKFTPMQMVKGVSGTKISFKLLYSRFEHTFMSVRSKVLRRLHLFILVWITRLLGTDYMRLISPKVNFQPIYLINNSIPPIHLFLYGLIKITPSYLRWIANPHCIHKHVSTPFFHLKMTCFMKNKWGWNTYLSWQPRLGNTPVLTAMQPLGTL